MIEQSYYRPVDPVNYGRFPGHEKKRLDALGEAAMAAKYDRDNDPLRKAVGDAKAASWLTWKQVGARVGIDGKQLCGFVNGTQFMSDERRQIIRSWLTGPEPAESQGQEVSDNSVLIDRINKLEIQLQAAQARLMQLSEPSMVVEDGFKDRWQELHNRQVELTGKLTTLEKVTHDLSTKLGLMTSKLNRRMDDLSLRMTIERTEQPERPSFLTLIRQRLAL